MRTATALWEEFESLRSSQKASSNISTASAASKTKNIFLLESKKNLFLLSKMQERKFCSAGYPDAPSEFTIGNAIANKDCMLHLHSVLLTIWTFNGALVVL